MKRSYFLQWGSMLDPMELSSVLADRLGLEFERHESSYVGEYLKYSGMLADRLTVGPNQIPSGDFLAPRHGHFRTVVDMAVHVGRNQDRAARYRYLKQCCAQIDALVPIRDESTETD